MVFGNKYGHRIRSRKTKLRNLRYLGLSYQEEDEPLHYLDALCPTRSVWKLFQGTESQTICRSKVTLQAPFLLFKKKNKKKE